MCNAGFNMPPSTCAIPQSTSMGACRLCCAPLQHAQSFSTRVIACWLRYAPLQHVHRCATKTRRMCVWARCCCAH
eukprot:39662-Chlamydomonas_euryale.AAC.2